MEIKREIHKRKSGYTRIPNKVIEQLEKLKLGPYEYRTLMALLRMTYGEPKEKGEMSISKFQVLTGLNRRQQQQVLKKLMDKNMITQRRFKTINER